MAKKYNKFLPLNPQALELNSEEYTRQDCKAGEVEEQTQRKNRTPLMKNKKSGSE